MSVCGLDQPQATHNPGGGGGAPGGTFYSVLFLALKHGFCAKARFACAL